MHASFRWIFNLSHWFVGNLALLMSLVTIFLAGDLNAASFLPTVKHYRLLFAYVIVFVCVHIVLSFQRCVHGVEGDVEQRTATALI